MGAGESVLNPTGLNQVPEQVQNRIVSSISTLCFNFLLISHTTVLFMQTVWYRSLIIL